jgi:nitrogen fixation/metabolism regulation signal transduction histidine kinase
LLNDVITEYQSNPENNDSADKLRDVINYYLQNVNPKFSDLSEPALAKLTARIEQEKATIARRQAGAVIIFILSVLVGIGVVAAVTGVMIFSRRLIQSITQIVDAANAISRGDLDVAINVEQGGEMGELANAIDRMRTSLKAAIERLRR